MQAKVIRKLYNEPPTAEEIAAAAAEEERKANSEYWTCNCCDFTSGNLKQDEATDSCGMCGHARNAPWTKPEQEDDDDGGEEESTRGFH